MNSDQFPLTALQQAIDEIKRRLDTLERPTGTSTSSLLSQVQQTLANISAQVASITTAFLASGFTTGSIRATGNVTVDGTLTATGGITSAGVNANDLSSAGGGSKVVYSNNTSKQLGFLTSSRRFKQDIRAARFDYEKLRAITVYFFRYRAAVESDPDTAYLWMGAMAEDLHEAGFTQLVDYEDGKPFGIQQQLMWVIPQMLAQQQADLIDELAERVDALERR